MGSTPTAQEPDLAPGTMVGDYRIDHTIGIGGMAAVYQATQPVIGKRVAIKVLHRTKSETALNRFIKEARAVNLIGHPNIVDVFGFGMTDSGRAYLVMELLVGETLAVRIKRGPISVAETCEILIEVAHALEAAHEASVIHRDLKPENIFLAKRKEVSSVKLLDFGIAKLIDGFGEPGREDDTRPGVLIGTPRYISPEQVRGNVLDGRADVYALGVVAFELLAGRPPFSGAAGAYELFEKHAKLKPPKPSAFNVQLPELADDLIGAMLAKEPGERPSLPSIRETFGKLRVAPASALAAQRAAAAAEPTDVHAAPPASAMQPEAPTTKTERALPSTPATVPAERVTSSAMETPTRQISLVDDGSRRRRVVMIALGAAIAAGIAIAIATTGNKLPSHADAATPAPAVAQPQPQVTPITPVAAATATPDGATTAATPATNPDEPAIELDPVAHTPVHVPRARHPRPSTAKSPASDDDVRSPFERAP